MSPKKKVIEPKRRIYDEIKFKGETIPCCHCGSQIPKDATFCFKCGYLIKKEKFD